MIALTLASALAASTITAPGPNGPLEGTFIDAGKGAPIVLIVPGSGPTDRDGNNPLGVTAAPYRMLAEALAGNGVSSVRIDKRGMFGSKGAIPDANKVTIADYAADVHNWAKVIRQRTESKCVWVAGHSEGGVVALAAGQDKSDLCGIVAISAMGRKFGTVLREQLRANPANAPILSAAEKAIDELEAGRDVPTTSLPPVLMGLFNPAVQPFLKDLMAHDSAALAASLKLPLLILSGDLDIQTPVADAKALAAAQPTAKLVIANGVNHVLKSPDGTDRAANLATYGDPARPISPAIVNAVAGFVKAKR
ncbi:alpha/beta hydrolase [Sphingomonas sp. HDW15A]|uniref:alpha/beta hydrolase n=1 Tax=Sphingomonas sp. HDW15A TaxID=2714942 RepID=UPI001407660D|nr:alpha/beta fold hydrolase [Sphingomonas sp. HDW15A]QIK97041.1 alpha/beta hydrolase [Sphingomonas sp. HDW15A]